MPMEAIDISQMQWCEEIYKRKSAELILYGRSLGLSHSEAEDVLQETFVALLEKAPPENPEHYCVRAYRNRAINYKRSLWRRIKRELESAHWFEKGQEETDMERAAMDCLRKIPSEQREIIVLKIWHEYTFEAIAELLNLSPNTIAGRYRYGMQKLKTCLDKKVYERNGIFGKANAELAPSASF